MWLPAMCYMYSMGVITAVCLVYEISCGHKSSPQLTHVTCTFACLPSFLFNMSIDRSTIPCHWWHPRPFRNHHCPSFPSNLHWITSPSSPSPLCSSTIKEEICLTTDKWAPQFKEGQKRRRRRRRKEIAVMEVSIRDVHLCGVCVCVCACACACTCHVLASHPVPITIPTVIQGGIWGLANLRDQNCWLQQ